MKKHIIFLFVLLHITQVFTWGFTRTKRHKKKVELRKTLSDKVYYVTQVGAYENANSGEYINNFEDGAYNCVICDKNLFSSAHKVKSAGWPVFHTPSDNVNLKQKTFKGKEFFQATCNNCKSFLGDMQIDNRVPVTGKKFTINSTSLKFDPVIKDELYKQIVTVLDENKPADFLQDKQLYEYEQDSNKIGADTTLQGMENNDNGQSEYQQNASDQAPITQSSTTEASYDQPINENLTINDLDQSIKNGSSNGNDQSEFIPGDIGHGNNMQEMNFETPKENSVLKNEEIKISDLDKSINYGQESANGLSEYQPNVHSEPELEALLKNELNYMAEEQPETLTESDMEYIESLSRGKIDKGTEDLLFQGMEQSIVDESNKKYADMTGSVDILDLSQDVPEPSRNEKSEDINNDPSIADFNPSEFQQIITDDYGKEKNVLSLENVSFEPDLIERENKAYQEWLVKDKADRLARKERKKQARTETIENGEDHSDSPESTHKNEAKSEQSTTEKISDNVKEKLEYLASFTTRRSDKKPQRNTDYEPPSFDMKSHPGEPGQGNKLPQDGVNFGQEEQPEIKVID